jgi:predicted outer membrane repeat protein
MKLAALIAAVLTLSLIVPAQAGTITVDAGGGGNHTTIAAAVAAAIDGDTIDILSDITEHSISVNKSLTFVGQGADLTTVQNTTAGMRIFNLTASNKTYVFEDLTLTGGDSSGAGGAINMEKWKGDSTVTINRMAFVDNDAYTLGGAVSVNDQSTAANNRGTITITNSTFSGNAVDGTGTYTGSGGAVYIGSVAAPTVRNSTFSDNTADMVGAWHSFGGALYINANGTSPVGLVQNSTFVNNSMTGSTSGTGGGAIYGTGAVTVESCVFAGNAVPAGARGIVNLDLGAGAYGTIINSLSEGDILSWTTDGGGNTEFAADAGVDPNLLDNGGPTLTHALLTGSPAIDAGSNPAGLTYDQRGAGYARVFGSGTDMGAYEVATLCVMGDANGDGEVGIADLSALADNYGRTNATWLMGDFNGDGEVGIADLSALADNYGNTGDPCDPDAMTVPEPATMAVLGLGSLAVLCRRRRR